MDILDDVEKLAQWTQQACDISSSSAIHALGLVDHRPFDATD
ncbi:MAG: hypothetical protein DHS20C17_35830 [Cyclobacteriaceae bacterium]|nr:MAG: hypothetical protein DHS20C17_35830 [Cyclobacteriaceae bacterium]